MRDFQVVSSSAAPGHHSFEVVIPRNSRYFAGHFPRRRILPAVAHLLVVDHLLRQSLGSEAWIARVDRYRLLQPIGPGDRLSVRLEFQRGSASARFTLDRGETRLSDGSFEWALDVQR